MDSNLRPEFAALDPWLMTDIHVRELQFPRLFHGEVANNVTAISNHTPASTITRILVSGVWQMPVEERSMIAV